MSRDIVMVFRRESRFWQTAAEVTGGVVFGLAIAAAVILR